MNTHKQAIPRIMFAGTGSGCGKTTITCGILKALINRSLKVASFKCGPDYIDPMFHSKIIGAKSRNLDIFMCKEDGVKFLLARNAKECDFSVIEGVMGLYDGLAFDSDYASSNHLSLLTDTPTILIVNIKGMSLSSVAMLGGYLNFKENNIKGVILNGCSEAMYPYYKKLIEEELSIIVYGFFPLVTNASIESRHLGLVTADEILGINEKIELLAQVAEKSIDIDGLLKLGQSAIPIEYSDIWQDVKVDNEIQAVKIAVAKDSAFCFLYQDNLDLLERAGAELVYFSPISDREIPNGISGLILSGGYPEEHAKALSQNKPMLNSIKSAVAKGVPTIAECGGFMYLLDDMADRNGEHHSMAGVIGGSSHMTSRLSRFGYINLIAKEDNLLCKKGEEIKAHEFHYSDSDNNGDGFSAIKPTTALRKREWECIHVKDNLFAGYPHMHFGGNTKPIERFVARCQEYK